MAYISNTTTSNTLFPRLTSATQAIQGEQKSVVSSRHDGPLERTTSAPIADPGTPASPPSTYTNPAQGAKGSLGVISSKIIANNFANPATKNPVTHFESMGAVNSLVARYQETTDGHGYRANAGQLFDLSVKTKDGDTITLSISADFFLKEEGGAMSLARETSFSFVVAGELSDEEREAVDALVSHLGDVAQVYQQDGWADVDFLGAFDSDVLAGLDLSVAGDNGQALTIAYSLDSDTGMHALAVSQNDYEYELNAETEFDQEALALHENALYQQYQQVLIDTTRSYKAGEFSGGVKSAEAAEFFLDGLEAILSPLNADKDVVGINDSSNVNIYESSDFSTGEIDSKTKKETVTPVSADWKNSPRKDSTEEKFLSGLPDFSASFNTPRFTPNASNSREISQMTMNLEQVTDTSISPSSGVKTVEQSYTYESRVSQHFGIGGDSVEHANLADVDQPGGQTYLYEVVNQSASLTRTLDIDPDDQAVAYSEDKQSEHFVTTKEVVQGEIQATKKEDLTNPQENYSFALQVLDSPAKAELHAVQINGYKNIQMLENAIQSHHIDLYL